MRATILSIGDELVIGRTTDTNAAWLARELSTLGIKAVEFAVVPDDRGAIAAAYARLAACADILISTGGLGPTADDLTRFALGDVITPGAALELDQAGVAHLETWFRGRAMPVSNTVQAQRPQGTRFLPNGAGTAMGIAGAIGTCNVFALPGPPREMKRMFAESVAPELERSAHGDVILSEEVIEFGLGESDAAARLGEMMTRGRNPQVGTTAGESLVAARIIAAGPRNEMTAALESTVREIEKHWQPYAFGRSGASLEAGVGELLRQQKLTLATAESCTGGLLGSMLVRIAGSSAYYLGGWITYSNELKRNCIGVSEEALAKHGAVSCEVAAEMAHGALRAAGANCALSITGIAGPDGGAPDKPVGTVYIGLARRADSATGAETEVRHFRFSGDRQIVRDRSAKAALQMLRFALLGERHRPLLWEVESEAMPWRRAAIALGSNLGDRNANLHFATEALRNRLDVRNVRFSDAIETDPVGPPGQGRYLNAAMSFETTLPPRELLAVLLDLERQRGRDRLRETKNGPRTLDLDLLLYADQTIDEPGLHVPHPRLHERRFVLEPLAQIEPNWLHPLLGESVESLAKSLVESEERTRTAHRAATGRTP